MQTQLSVFAGLICNTARSFASRLARCLTLTAAALAVCKISCVECKNPCAFAGLVCNTARSFASGLARCLALTAAALAVCKISCVKRDNSIHKIFSFNHNVTDILYLFLNTLSRILAYNVNFFAVSALCTQKFNAVFVVYFGNFYNFCADFFARNDYRYSRRIRKNILRANLIFRSFKIGFAFVIFFRVKRSHNTFKLLRIYWNFAVVMRF